MRLPHLLLLLFITCTGQAQNFFSGNLYSGVNCSHISGYRRSGGLGGQSYERTTPTELQAGYQFGMMFDNAVRHSSFRFGLMYSMMQSYASSESASLFPGYSSSSYSTYLHFKVKSAGLQLMYAFHWFRPMEGAVYTGFYPQIILENHSRINREQTNSQADSAHTWVVTNQHIEEDYPVSVTQVNWVIGVDLGVFKWRQHPLLISFIHNRGLYRIHTPGVKCQSTMLSVSYRLFRVATK